MQTTHQMLRRDSGGVKRVGIYSGTFDPVHNGHLAFAREAIEQCNLDKVFFLVEPRPRRKQGVKALEHRFQMVQLAIATEPQFGSIMLEQPQFTAEQTLPVLRARFKGAQLCMLMGDDMLGHFADWPHVDLLIQNVMFIIGLRHLTRKEVTSKIRTVEQTRSLHLDHQIFQAKEPEVSSSTIKQSLKSGSTHGLPPAVAGYIKQHRLYTSTSGS